MRRVAARLGLVLACVSLAGCSTLGYVGQAVGGHLELLRLSRPVSEWLADERTPPALRERLRRSQQMRDFAVAELHLPDNRSYRRYADLGREAVLWNVVAAPELGLALKTWCVPLMGCVGYRGSFDRGAADALAAELRQQGWDTRVYGVPAYSTLGWTDWLGGDPLLNTFLHWPAPELARLLFHELAHQVVYVGDDTVFNESFATAVQRLGGQRWLAQHASAAEREADVVQARRQEDFRALSARTRARLQTVYGDASLGDADKRRRKAEVMARMRSEYAALKAGPWQGAAGYDTWVATANNASFALQAAYNAQVPAFEALFEREGADFRRFYAAVKVLAALPKPERDRRLQVLAGASSASRINRTPAPRRAAVPDIKIHRDHRLGLAKACKVAWQWAEQVEQKFDMACTVIEGETSDTVEFTRSGVNGRLIVAADHFDLDAKLGFLLGAFSKTIEGEIEKNLDSLLADSAGKARARPKAGPRKA